MTTDASQSTAASSRLERLGQLVALALAPALLVGVLGAWRTGAAGGSVLDGWLVSAAVVLVMLLPIALLRGHAARGYRGLAGAAPPRDLGVGIALWAGLSVTWLLALGALLESRTHHSALAGTTFGLVGLGGVLGAAVAAHRLIALGAWLRGRGWPPWLLASGAGLIAAGPTLALATPWLLSRAALSPAEKAAAAVVADLLVVIAVGATLFVRGLPRALRPIAVKAAVPLAAFVIIGGAVRVELGKGVGQSIRAGGGLASVVLWVLEQWSDRDGDGFSAHFGGNDCDDGDPSRYPGAVETVRDGVDRDCDGSPEPAETAPATGNAALAAADADRGAPTAPATASAAASGSAAARSEPPAAPERPDLILVTLDTVGARHCSTYGYERETTPALTKLASVGLKLAHAYAPGSSTQAALTPLVTCRPFGESRRSADEWPTLLDENDTLAERLKRAGYATAAVTSFTWLRLDRGFSQGFDTFSEAPFRAEHPERSTTGAEATRAVQEIYGTLVGTEGPIFLWIHLFDPHAKYVEHDGIDFGKGASDRYDGEVAFTDRQLAAIVETISKGPRASRTLWLVHGSHGEAFGEHDEVGHGTDLWEEMIHVPMVIAAPWIEPRTYDARAVSTLDVAPTLLDLGGADREGVIGVSLKPLLAKDDGWKRPAIIAYAPRRVAVVDWPLKLLVRRRTDAPDRLLLFDLAEDPTERTDVSGDRKNDLDRMVELRRGLEEGSGSDGA